MRFKPVSSVATQPATPLLLFDDLPRMSGAVPELWRQQADLLRTYGNLFTAEPDVAVELPTGTGKTVVGLLIGEWRRRKLSEQVVYACPTQQLAYQVAAVAKRESIPAVTLVGSSRLWNRAHASLYESADALAITTYSTVFNLSPKIGTPGTLVFDDSHAGEQYVAEAWSVAVDRTEHHAVWQQLIEVLKPALDGMYIQRLFDLGGDPSVHQDVRLVVPSRRPGMVERIDDALGALPDGDDQSYRRSMIRGGLASCLVYVGWQRVLIRPFIPPTSENLPFSMAKQRLYLSATLGRGGELERAFGRPLIKRLPLPEDAQNPRSGRRFFVFSDLARDGGTSLTRLIVSEDKKALILAPSQATAAAVAAEICPPGAPVFTKEDVATSLEPFAAARQGLLALAGRYDGLDLPGNACRIVVLDGLPTAAHLQERFLEVRVRAGAALEERIRTRVVQGVGRCTRGPSDYAVAVLNSADLARYLSNKQRAESLDPDLQAEIKFGLENSRGVEIGVVLDNVRTFLAQGDDWRNEAEPYLVAARRAATRQDASGAIKLAAAVRHEVEACQFAWRQDYAAASKAAGEAAVALSGEEDVRTYRAFWTYLAAVWRFAASAKDPSAYRTAVGLLDQANEAARGTTWLREADPGESSTSENADDTPAIRAIARRIERGIKRGDIEAQIQRMHSGLAEAAPSIFEPGLTELGKLLGADACKPSGKGRCDSAWCWEGQLWVALEAKTEEGADKEIPMRDVRQANTQLASLAADRGVEAPETSATIIISHQTRIDPDAITIANRDVFLVGPDDVRAMAVHLETAWQALLSQRAGYSGPDLEALIRRIFGGHEVLPTQVRERLTRQPVRG
jgi:hypothetical protein